MGYPFSRPAKRRKTAAEANEERVSILPHPLRIKPLGNAFATDTSNLRDTSIGSFSVLLDELIVQLLGYLDCGSLICLGSTCKGLYAYCRFEELWKDLLIRSKAHRPVASWRGTWRETYLYHRKSDSPPFSPIRIPNLYSDVLYRPFFCAQVEFEKYTCHIPTENLIPRLIDLTLEEFNRKWANKPFVLTAPVRSWPGFKKWSIDSFVSKYGDVNFRAEAVNWPLKVYHEYMINNHDESPLYLFDKEFAEKTRMDNEYDIPSAFQEDFFEVLGDERPDRRWLILGPRGSGSTFHKDPNATSAWNAVIQGSKYWVMFPQIKDFSPPGVFVSQDQSEVTSPLSISEWLLGFHKEARRSKGCLEGICRSGEILHVPSGWWHLVLNLSNSLAVTQNFVPRKHLSSVLLFLRDQPQSVSGFDCNKVKDPYTLFTERMKAEYPTVFKEAMVEMGQMGDRTGQKGAKWVSLVEEAKSGTGFSFSFEIGESEDENK